MRVRSVVAEQGTPCCRYYLGGCAACVQRLPSHGTSTVHQKG